jgi:hypothetical protein
MMRSAVSRLWRRLTLADARQERDRWHKERDDAQAELDLLLYGLEHPGEWVHVPPGHPARNGILAKAWRH